jgi:hypothetical protein
MGHNSVGLHSVLPVAGDKQRLYGNNEYFAFVILGRRRWTLKNGLLCSKYANKQGPWKTANSSLAHGEQVCLLSATYSQFLFYSPI